MTETKMFRSSFEFASGNNSENHKNPDVTGFSHPHISDYLTHMYLFIVGKYSVKLFESSSLS